MSELIPYDAEPSSAEAMNVPKPQRKRREHGTPTKEKFALVQTAIAADWRDRIRTAWQKSVESIIETGHLIAEAKAALAHGEFTAMIESDLPFGGRTARRLMTIAADERISDRTHGSVLPASWGTLYELTKLPDKVFDAKIKDGTINPKMERKAVTILLGKAKPRHEFNAAATPAPQKWVFADASMRLLEAIEREFNRYGAMQEDAPIIAYILREHAKGLTDGNDEPDA